MTKFKQAEKQLSRKKIFFRELTKLVKKHNSFNSFDCKKIANDLGLSLDTGLQYAKQWRRKNLQTKSQLPMIVIPICERVYLSDQGYKKFTKDNAKIKAYAFHYSITIKKNNLHFLNKCRSLRYDRNGKPYLWIDKRRYFAKDPNVNGRNFLKVTKKYLDAEIEYHLKAVHMMSQKMKEILDKGVKPRREGALVELAKKSWFKINDTISMINAGKNEDFEPIKMNCTPYTYTLNTKPFNFLKNNIPRSWNIRKKIKMTKEEIKARYWEKYWEKRNKKQYSKKLEEDFNNLRDAIKYRTGWGFEEHGIYKDILVQGGCYCRKNERIFVNMYKKFRYVSYHIEKNKQIKSNNEEEQEMILYWVKRYISRKDIFHEKKERQ